MIECYSTIKDGRRLTVSLDPHPSKPLMYMVCICHGQEHWESTAMSRSSAEAMYEANARFYGAR